MSVYEPARRWSSDTTQRQVPHDEAKRIAQRLISASFRRDDERLPPESTPHFSIPTRTEHDDDCLIIAYIEQSTADEPLPTATAKARFGLVMPVTHSRDEGNRSRSLDEPVPTITTAHRGELAVIVASPHSVHLGERDGQAPRVHSIDAPCPTICASGRVQLAQPGERQWDIRFRMLQPHELAAAMGFSGEDAAYEFAGNKTEVTKQIGNAVCVGQATALVAALFSDQGRR